MNSGNIPIAKSYLDVVSSWSTNEYAIDYISSAVYALSWFAEPDSVKVEDLKYNK